MYLQPYSMKIFFFLEMKFLFPEKFPKIIPENNLGSFLLLVSGFQIFMIATCLLASLQHVAHQMMTWGMSMSLTLTLPNQFNH